MESNTKRCCKTKKTNQSEKPAQDYAGVAVNIADDNTVDAKMVKDRTKSMNNNPRNDDM